MGKIYLIYITAFLFFFFCIKKISSASEYNKEQRHYMMLVEECICDWLDLEAENDTNMNYERIVSGCNYLISDKILPKGHEKFYHNPNIYKLECTSSISRWIESKSR